MKEILDEVRGLSLKTWIVLCIFFLLFFDMAGYYLAVLTHNAVKPFYIMEQIVPFITGSFNVK